MPPEASPERSPGETGESGAATRGSPAGSRAEPHSPRRLQTQARRYRAGLGESEQVPNDVLDAALDHVDITLAEARKRLDDRAVARLEARLATLRHEWGADWVDWLFGRKVDELAPGHADGPASRECRGQALHWLDGNLRRVAQLTPDALALFDHRLEELGRLEPANAEQLERAIDYAQAQIQIQAGDIERRRTVIFQTPGADSAYRDLFRAGFGQSPQVEPPGA